MTTDPSWDGRQENGRHEALNLLFSIGLEKILATEGPGTYDQLQAAIADGHYAGRIETVEGQEMALLDVAGRPFIGMPVVELEAMLNQLDPGVTDVS